MHTKPRPYSGLPSCSNGVILNPMKLHFDGTRQELEQIVESSGIKGKWHPDGEGSRFTTDDGGILVWYGRIIKMIMFQGKEPARSKLREALKRHFGDQPAGSPPL